MAKQVKELISVEQIQTRVQELAKQITRDFQDRDLVLVGVLKGSFMFMADLCRYIDLPLACDFFGVSSYGYQSTSSGIIRITSDLSHSIEGKDVIVIEDIIDTGLTMEYLITNLRARRPKSISICTLLHKPDCTIAPIKIDYLGFTIENVFVVGYGLDYKECYRNLNYLGVLIEESKNE